jgi:hypothetical protein
MAALTFAHATFFAAFLVPSEGRIQAIPQTLPGAHPLSSYDLAVVERVRTRAAAKLEDPSCSKVLSDFTDRGGRTLEANLTGLNVSPAGYLLQLTFLDGSRVGVCRNGAVAMASSPGAPRVFVCPAQAGPVRSRLARLEFERGSLVEAMMIHEMLHTLGLGENPPTTFEITERIRARCR